MEEVNCFYDEEEKSIQVNFSDYFEKDLGIDCFRLFRKRSYTNPVVANTIVDVMKKAFTDMKIFTFYAKIRYRIENFNYSEEEFAKDCSVISRLCSKVATEYIEGKYVPEETQKLDKVGSAKKENIELQFTDEHNKMVLRASFIMKFICPLITEYMYQNKIVRNEQLFLDCFAESFEVAKNGQNVDIKGKIWKIVDSRLKATRYSDQVIWSFLTVRALHPSVTLVEFYRKIIIDILPKLDLSRPIIFYLHVTLRRMIMYRFHCNFETTFTPVNLAETVADERASGTTSLERFEFHLPKLDESEKVISKAKIMKCITDIIHNENIIISGDELRYYKERIQINSMQTNLLFLFFSKKVGKYQTLYTLRFSEYALLLVYFKHWLKKNNFVFLEKWITCTFPEGISTDRKTINTKEFIEGLSSSISFKNLFEKKYSHITTNMTKSNLIARMITTIFSNTAEYLPSFEEHENPNFHRKDIRDINDFPISLVTEEILRFIDQL